MFEVKVIEIYNPTKQRLVVDYYPGTQKRGVICLHQNSADRKSFTNLAQELQHLGYHVLAPDFHGYGQSDGNKENFTEKDFLSLFDDVRVVDDYLRKIITNIEVQMVGCSIGANTALRYQEMNTLNSVVAVSPGLDYFGIQPLDSVLSNIATPTLFVNSQGDKYSQETQYLFEQSPLTNSQKDLKLYPGNQHGIWILDDNQQAMDDVINWLNSH